MNMNGVHCQVSPTSTMSRADQAWSAHDQAPRPSAALDRRERPFLHVGEHPEHVGDADGRHHQRNEEHDPEEAARADRLRAEKRKAKADQRIAP